MSLDAAEVIMAIEEEFEITISDPEASGIATPADLIAHVRKAVGSGPQSKWSGTQWKVPQWK